MIEIDSLHLMIVLELLGLLVLICAVAGILALLRSRRERSAIDRLVAAVKEDGNRRQEETKNLLAKRYGYQGEDLQQVARKIHRQELLFYQTLINLFIKRDAGAMESLNIVFEDTVAPYRELKVPKGGAPMQEAEAIQVTATPILKTSEEPAEDNSAELRRLQAENKNLMEELQLTMNSMGRMLGEYANMCGEDVDDSVKAMAELTEQGAAEEDTGSSEEFLFGSEESEGAPEADAGLEPGWDEALEEQLLQGDGTAESSGDEEELSWDDALEEQLKNEPKGG